MNPEKPRQTVPLAEPKRVDIEAIERELHGLWRDAAEAHAGEAGQDVIRACIGNLVAVVTEARLETAADVVDALTVQHPCRALVIVLDPAAPAAGLEASITARCHLPETGGKQVCCEQIVISARGDVADEVPALVLALLVADLPVFLWWDAGPSVESRLLDSLAGIADRVIIDSRNLLDAEDLGLLAAARDRLPHTAFGDLNWSRLTPWRELVAQAFDAASHRPLLGRITGLRIAHGGDEIQSLLLAGWVGSRLGWEPSGGEASNGRSRYALTDRSGHPVAVEILAEPGPSSPGRGVARLELSAGEGDAFRLTVDGREEAHALTTTLMAGDQPTRRRAVRWDPAFPVDLLGQQLEVFGRDAVYEEALMLAGRLAAERRSRGWKSGSARS